VVLHHLAVYTVAVLSDPKNGVAQSCTCRSWPPLQLHLCPSPGNFISLAGWACTSTVIHNHSDNTGITCSTCYLTHCCHAQGRHHTTSTLYPETQALTQPHDRHLVGMTCKPPGVTCRRCCCRHTHPEQQHPHKARMLCNRLRHGCPAAGTTCHHKLANKAAPVPAITHSKQQPTACLHRTPFVAAVHAKHKPNKAHLQGLYPYHGTNSTLCSSWNVDHAPLLARPQTPTCQQHTIA